MTRLVGVFAVVVALVALPGCPEDSTNQTPDLSGGADMAVKDGGGAPGSCAAVLGCIAMCTNLATQATCVTTCAGTVTTGATYLGALSACQGTHCTPDAGTQCTSMGVLASSCQMCVMTNCLTQYNACLTH
jgi:hypothetical protein